MKRLTKRNSCGVEIVGNKARQALNRLAEYEDIGMTADEIKCFLRDYGISQAIKRDCRSCIKWTT